jgi:mono/diheme cytochrome c family protein
MRHLYSVFLLMLPLSAAALFLWAMGPLPVAAQESTPVPTEAADANVGMALFQQRCANCHGITGLGDGEMAGDLPRPPGAIGSADYIDTAVPAEMAAVIRNGILAGGMPPFGPASSNPLSDAQIRHLIAALYAMGTPSADVRAGSEWYDAALFDAVDWENRSNAALRDQLAAAAPDLAPDAVRPLVAWARLNSLNYVLSDGTIIGSVYNQSNQRSLTDGIVTLEAFQGFTLAATFTTTLGTDGTFVFAPENIPPDWILRTSIAHQGIDYSAGLFQLNPDGSAPPQTITVYDTTADNSVLMLEQLHMVIEPGDATHLVVSQFYAWRNTGAQTFVGQIPYRVPTDALDVTFMLMGSMTQFMPATTVISADGVGEYVDTAPFRPGSSGLLVRYVLPYSGESTFSQRLAWEPTAISLIVTDGIEVGGNGITRGATEVFEGVGYVNYMAEPAGTQLAFTLSGNPVLTVAAGRSGTTLTRDTNRELAVGGAALALTVAAAGWTIAQWRRQAPPDPTALLQEVAALDDARVAKAIPAALYEQRRKALMQQLRDIWTYEQAP